jgi:AP endonuclease-1
VTHFDHLVGLAYLQGMHLNDSKGALGSKKDRHENIGMYVGLSTLLLRQVDIGDARGDLGIAAFAHIVSDPRTQGIPLVLETPNAEADRTVWSTEVAALNALAMSVDPDGIMIEEREKIRQVVQRAGKGADVKKK